MNREPVREERLGRAAAGFATVRAYYNAKIREARAAHAAKRSKPSAKISNSSDIGLSALEQTEMLALLGRKKTLLGLL